MTNVKYYIELRVDRKKYQKRSTQMKFKALLIALICSLSPIVAMENVQTNTPQETTSTRTQSASFSQLIQSACVRNSIIAAITGAALPYVEKMHPIVAMMFILHQLQQID